MTVREDFERSYFKLQQLTEDRQYQVRRTFDRLADFTGQPPETTDADTLEGFLAHRLDSGKHVNTVAFELSCLRPFFRWCWKRDIIDANTWLRIADVKAPRGASKRGQPRPYKRDELERLWAAIPARYPRRTDEQVAQWLKRWERGTTSFERIWHHAWNVQMHAIVAMALFHGLRRQEVCNLDVVDAHPDNEYIAVRGKSPVGRNQGSREVPYTTASRQMVAEWLELRAALKPQHDGLWLNAKPSDPASRLAEVSFEELLSRIGPWEFHRLRHTCGTEWLRAGVSLELVSRYLGHSTIQQTLVYAELLSGDIQRAVERSEADVMKVLDRRARQIAPHDLAA